MKRIRQKYLDKIKIIALDIIKDVEKTPEYNRYISSRVPMLPMFFKFLGHHVCISKAREDPGKTCLSFWKRKFSCPVGVSVLIDANDYSIEFVDVHEIMLCDLIYLINQKNEETT